jgi:hypothetical protein
MMMRTQKGVDPRDVRHTRRCVSTSCSR